MPFLSKESQRACDFEDALRSLAGAMRYVLAFYEPGQTYLDTNAWKLAEAEARAAYADAMRILALYANTETPSEPPI